MRYLSFSGAHSFCVLNTTAFQVRETGINPYVQLLHDWKKNKEQERESGAFVRQYRAHKKPVATVDPVQGDPVRPSQPIAAQGNPRQGEL